MPDWTDKLFGTTEKEQFARGIGQRRKKAIKERAGIREYTDEDMMGLVGPGIPMVGMTRYLKAGVPDIAKRVAGTSNFLERMKTLGIDAERASKLFAERYPRIAAHMNIEHLTPEMQKMHPTAEAFTDVGKRARGAFPEQTPVLLGPRATQAGQRNMEDVLLHEGTHVAQDLGNKNTLGMYNASSEALKKLGFGDRLSYWMNPFEVSARTAASRKLGENLAPHKALGGVDKLVTGLPAGDPTRIKLGKLRRR